MRDKAEISFIRLESFTLLRCTFIGLYSLSFIRYNIKRTSSLHSSPEPICKQLLLSRTCLFLGPYSIGNVPRPLFSKLLHEPVHTFQGQMCTPRTWSPLANFYFPLDFACHCFSCNELRLKIGQQYWRLRPAQNLVNLEFWNAIQVNDFWSQDNRNSAAVLGLRNFILYSYPLLIYFILLRACIRLSWYQV